MAFAYVTAFSACNCEGLPGVRGGLRVPNCVSCVYTITSGCLYVMVAPSDCCLCRIACANWGGV